MGRVRAFAKNDVLQVAQLYMKVFSSRGGPPSEGLSAYISELFLGDPWYDSALPSLVYEGDDRRIVGFLGIMPRRMVMRGRPLKVAVGSQFMVEPSSRSTFAGIKLLKALFSGPQELALTDGANAIARQVWETFGGISVPIYSIYWTRTLRLSQYGVDLFENTRNGWRSTLMNVRPLWQIVDAIADRIEPYRFGHKRLPFIAEEEMDEAKVCDILSKLSAFASLRPKYDPCTLKWLLGIAAQKTKFGHLRGEVVRNDNGEIVGWYLYYLNVGGVSEVLQLAALPQTISSVLDHLFYSAWRHGSKAISGRIEPRYMHELYHRRCHFTCGSAFLIQSRYQEVLHAICTGDAFLTRLEGEWWNRFNELVQ